MFWLRGRHPKEPSSWRADVRDAEERVAAWARGELKLAEGEDVFEERWGEQKVKVAFSGQQHLKCAYCEMSIASDPNGGDMDHLRPKAVITRLLDDPATWGEEIADHNSRDPKKRRQAPEVCRGYWWLAYAWRNLVLTCGVCNRKWKVSLFPIEGGHRHAPTTQSHARERALLLDPYGDIDPAEHLEFDRIGLVTPHKDSVIGWETIRTCNLVRETLRSSREPDAKRAWPLISRVLHELFLLGTQERFRAKIAKDRKAHVLRFAVLRGLCANFLAYRRGRARGCADCSLVAPATSKSLRFCQMRSASATACHVVLPGW
jgi:hypothetical protein